MFLLYSVKQKLLSLTFSALLSQELQIFKAKFYTPVMCSHLVHKILFSYLWIFTNLCQI